MLTFVFTSSAIVHKRSGVFEENQGSNQRRRRSPVHLNWLFTQTLSSFSAAILKRSQGFGHHGAVHAGIHRQWRDHPPVALTFTRFRATCCQGELPAVWQQKTLPFVLVLSVWNDKSMLLHHLYSNWILRSSFESFCQACATFTLLKMHSKLTIKVIINKCFVNN